MCCTSKVAFLLIRPIVGFHRSPALPSQLSITRVYIFFEQTISMRNKKQDIHVKCSNGSFSQPRGIFHVSILIYLFRYLQSANLVCVVSYGCVYHAIKQSCSYDTNKWHHGQNTYRFISEASSYTEHSEWDHYSNYPFVSHKFLVSEIVKMNGQESVNSYRENTKKWGKNK